jgi:hypothetical protein
MVALALCRERCTCGSTRNGIVRSPRLAARGGGTLTELGAKFLSERDIQRARAAERDASTPLH